VFSNTSWISQKKLSKIVRSQESSSSAAFSDFSSAIPAGFDPPAEKLAAFGVKSAKAHSCNDGSASNSLHHVFVADLVRGNSGATL
jgi:hypothetical protein